jgi:hypothetical protein
MTQTNKPLANVELELANLIREIESAEDPTTAFNSLKSNLSEYISRNNSLREDWHKQRNTIQSQANKLTEIGLDSIVEAENHSDRVGETQAISIAFPDTITVETAPNCQFLKLSFGFVNLLSITLLDVKARTLYTHTHTRTLGNEDIKTLIFHLKLYTR